MYDMLTRMTGHAVRVPTTFINTFAAAERQVDKFFSQCNQNVISVTLEVSLKS
jgi:hypothetical protein